MESGNFVTVVDPVFIFVTVVAVLFIVGITATMLYFLYRYNKKRNKIAKDIHGHAGLEVIWTLVPMVIVTAMFYFGWVGFKKMLNPPKDAMEVKVTGRMWSWLFEYHNGIQTDTLYVPTNKPIKLTLNSLDVIHSFYIPAFRVKKDVVPGKLKNKMWFIAEEAGSYDVECAEYCGQRHSYMLSKVIAMPQNEFNDWYASTAPDTTGKAKIAKESSSEEEMAQRGSMIIKTKGGCLSCHTLDGSKLIGPSFKGIFGKQVTVETDEGEKTFTVDEEYIRRSIHDPGVEIVKGFPKVMPTPPLTDEEIEEVVAFIKTLK
jgi:cytochrome c oxidase subunit 2